LALNRAINMLCPAGAVLLHAPSAEAKDRLKRDAEHLRTHIAAGSFASDVRHSDDFAEEHHDAARTWKLLQEQGFAPLGGASGGSTSTSSGKRPRDAEEGAAAAAAPPGKKELVAALKRHKSIEG
jgi:hypothetical protein